MQRPPLSPGAPPLYRVAVRTAERVIVVGAGPTGLMLANLLGSRGIPTTVLEQNAAPSPGTYGQSRAIGVTPPSLEILEQVGLADQFVAAGLPIRRAVVHGTRRTLGELRFEGVHGRYPFILSIPQHLSGAILRSGVDRYRCVEIEYHREVIDLDEGAGEGAREGGTPLVRCADGSVRQGTFCVAADGARGPTAGLAGISRRGRRYRPSFFMGDFEDHTGLGRDAHLWFTAMGAVESFPLPAGLRRWIVQLSHTSTEDAAPPQQQVDLEEIVARRTGWRLKRRDRTWDSAFQPAWSEARSFHRGRIFLLGDAAHTMSPIGGQGMNTGFADAELLALTLQRQLAHRQGGPDPGNRDDRFSPEEYFSPEYYHRVRRRAARAATRRAWAGMTVGTIRGSLFSVVRNGLVWMFLRPLLRRPLARHFTMLTIPGGRAS
jgi:2-polyprenyl-6-methoxyphenol hydroxylase-like FAD-dependent oxidoreductase